ncbi:MAG: hypothetical protein ACOYMG_09260 [Candidatus Methylumidiphilus sp.]
MVQPAIKIAVIPAWMPESSHRDVNLRMTQALVQAACYHPWHWIPASLPV